MMSGGHPTLVNVLSALCFAGFVLAGLLLTSREREMRASGRRQARVSAFLLYALGVSFLAGLSQRDLWPFSPWPIKALTPFPEVSTHRIVGVDAGGTEHGIDYRAWQPVGFDELQPWIIFRFPQLSPGAQDRAAAWLLDQAERARFRAREGGGVGYFERFLGPLTAPYFMQHPKTWRGPESVPAQSFVGLRIYKETWNLMERRRDPGRFERVRLYEYPRP